MPYSGVFFLQDFSRPGYGRSTSVHLPRCDKLEPDRSSTSIGDYRFAELAGQVQKDLDGTMATGRISQLMIHRGFGVIQEDDQQEELLFHWSAVSAGTLEQLSVGQRVEFQKEADARDPGRNKAVNVQLIR
jgi:cold shock CspA family protein